MMETLSTSSTMTVSVTQGVHALAHAITSTQVYRALEASNEQVGNDPAVSAAMRAFANKQADVEKARRRGLFNSVDGRELERLRAAIEVQPTVIAYREAEAELVALCQEVNRAISRNLGLDFAANAQRSSCCG